MDLLYTEVLTYSRQLADAAHAPRDAACALTRWQHFSAWNDAMAAIFKSRHQIDGYLLEE